MRIFPNLLSGKDSAFDEVIICIVFSLYRHWIAPRRKAVWYPLLAVEVLKQPLMEENSFGLTVSILNFGPLLGHMKHRIIFCQT